MCAICRTVWLAAFIPISKHFVAELCAIAADHQIVLYADTKRPFELNDLPPHVTLRLLPYRGPQSSVYLDYVGLRRAMARDRLDVVHYPANYGFRVPGARMVVTLHDALTIMPLRETLFSSGSRRTLRSMAMTVYLYVGSRLMLRDADMLLTVSQHAKQDILRYCRFDPQRIIPIPHAPTPDMRRISDEAVLTAVRQRYGIDQPFVLADALKNPGVLVRAWRRLPSIVASESSDRLLFAPSCAAAGGLRSGRARWRRTADQPVAPRPDRPVQHGGGICLSIVV
jgi:hypothetical protein